MPTTREEFEFSGVLLRNKSCLLLSTLLDEAPRFDRSAHSGFTLSGRLGPENLRWSAPLGSEAGASALGGVGEVCGAESVTLEPGRLIPW